MSKVLKIIVEGPTEMEFVRGILGPYMRDRGFLDVRPIGIETSPGHKGGDVRFARYSLHVTNELRGREDMLVTSLIDYYKLRHDFPDYEAAQLLPRVTERVLHIEQACARVIDDHRFIPYIQLHEFEALLFASMSGFDLLPDLPARSRTELERVIQEFPNPELINERPNLAPSKRLQGLIPGYRKRLYGSYIAEGNTMKVMLETCPRFKAWVDFLLSRAVNP